MTGPSRAASDRRDIHLYLAPAGGGKSAYLLDLVRDHVVDLSTEVRVCVPTRLQAAAWQRRLAKSGGALGVRVMVFDELYAECLAEAGESYTGLSEAVQYRLIKTIAERLPLVHYRSIAGRPGFVKILQRFIEELKGAQIFPEQFLEAVEAMGDEPRLVELGRIYEAYQSRLQDEQWADKAGLGWLAVEALSDRAPMVGSDWSLLLFDGFDSFTEIQCALLKILAARVDKYIITLTGDMDAGEMRTAHRRYRLTREKLERALDIQAEALPIQLRASSPSLSFLEANLFKRTKDKSRKLEGVELIEAPDRAAETRAAMRWLKARILFDDLRPDEAAFLARDLSPYRPFVVQTAREFGLPLHLIDGLPLSGSPIIVAILDLLRLVVSTGETGLDLALPRRLVVAAWRSPYFNWSEAYESTTAGEPIGITAGDAELLDQVARAGRVIGGLAHWRELLTMLGERSAQEPVDDEALLPDTTMTGPEAKLLEIKFNRFVTRLLPPQGRQRYRGHVRWLEGLLGPDPAELSRSSNAGREIDDRISFGVLARLDQDEDPIAGQEIAALRAFKNILRSLVWADEALPEVPGVDYNTFVNELSGAVETSVFYPPDDQGRRGILVTDVVQARGVPFKAVVIAGLSEGEFPATLSEDPLLPERDRSMLRQDHQLALESSIESFEREYFYEAVIRPRERLLITRPRLAEGGAEWLPSPFWEEIQGLVGRQPVIESGETVSNPEQAASLPELVESLVSSPSWLERLGWPPTSDSAFSHRLLKDRLEALKQAGTIVNRRYNAQNSVYDGDLTWLGDHFSTHFGPSFTWSPSGLESYQSCAFMFFISRVLRLEVRREPVEGIDAAQLGSIYHRILEGVYRHLTPADRQDEKRLMAALSVVAGKILDAAPRLEGFRENAWWEQTREEIINNVARSVTELARLDNDYLPTYFEVRFSGDNSLIVKDDGDMFRLHGIIDRVDRDKYGRLLVIDYKTAGPYSYGKNTLEQGRKLQLPLYALAAGEGLGLGEPVDGYYWHIRHAEASGLRLDDYGLEAAIQLALDHSWTAVRGVRRGSFVPEPPSEGCPGYCPATTFCWQYRPSQF